MSVASPLPFAPSGTILFLCSLRFKRHRGVMCRPGEARKRTVKDTRSYIAPYVWPAAAVGLSQA